jgi:HEAT repeat protein
VRCTAAEALGNLGDASAVEPLGKVAKTNYQAVRALGKLNSPGSAAALASVAQDRQTQVTTRIEAVMALAKLKDPGVVPALIQTMEQEVAADPSSTVAVQCVQELGKIKDRRTVEPLRKLLGKPTMPSQEAERVLREMAFCRRPRTKRSAFSKFIAQRRCTASTAPTRCDSRSAHELPKLRTWVRFPSPAP